MVTVLSRYNGLMFDSRYLPSWNFFFKNKKDFSGLHFWQNNYLFNQILFMNYAISTFRSAEFLKKSTFREYLSSFCYIELTYMVWLDDRTTNFVKMRIIKMLTFVNAIENKILFMIGFYSFITFCFFSVPRIGRV